MSQNVLRFTRRLLTLGGALGLATTLMTVTPVAHASPRMSSSTNRTAATVHILKESGCRVLEVALHGNANPTINCNLYASSTSSMVVAPTTLATFCDSGYDLKIYQDAFQSSSGSEICFYGTGFVNLTDYQINVFQSWNDQASSWSSGKWYGVFYKDVNGGGGQEAFSYNSAGEFDGQSGHLPNDSLSSFKIDGAGY